MPTRPSFALSSNTNFLMQELEKANIGDVVTYAKLSATISEKVTGNHPALPTARKRLRRDKQMVFGVIRGFGLKRLNDSEIVNTSDSTAAKIKRTAKRGVETLSAADFATLTNAEKLKHGAAISIFGAIGEVTKPRNMKKLESAIPTGHKALPIAATFKIFAKS